MCVFATCTVLYREHTHTSFMSLLLNRSSIHTDKKSTTSDYSVHVCRVVSASPKAGLVPLV